MAFKLLNLHRVGKTNESGEHIKARLLVIGGLYFFK
jgi:hypothetical protein